MARDYEVFRTLKSRCDEECPLRGIRVDIAMSALSSAIYDTGHLPRPTEPRVIVAFLRPICKTMGTELRITVTVHLIRALSSQLTAWCLASRNRRTLASIAYSEMARHGR
jgi:hypothetical protein